jgi:hypothetical protein
VSDLLYVLLTVASFVLIALLVGVLDRRLSDDGGDR